MLYNINFTKQLQVITFSIVVFSQLNVATAQKYPKLLEQKGNTNCVYKVKYSAEQRHQFYPFNGTDTVKLVSFRYHHSQYPFTRDTIITDSLIEITTLSAMQINKLTDILYNNFYKKDSNYGTFNQCWIPHNAILFFDKSGILKEFITICFHCNRYSESSKKIRLGDNCDQKMDKLRSFFISAGVQFGTDLNVDYGGMEEGVVQPPED